MSLEEHIVFVVLSYCAQGFDKGGKVVSGCSYSFLFYKMCRSVQAFYLGHSNNCE